MRSVVSYLPASLQTLDRQRHRTVPWRHVGPGPEKFEAGVLVGKAAQFGNDPAGTIDQFLVGNIQIDHVIGTNPSEFRHGPRGKRVHDDFHPEMFDHTQPDRSCRSRDMVPGHESYPGGFGNDPSAEGILPGGDLLIADPDLHQFARGL